MLCMPRSRRSRESCPSVSTPLVIFLDRDKPESDLFHKTHPSQIGPASSDTPHSVWGHSPTLLVSLTLQPFMMLLTVDLAELSF